MSKKDLDFSVEVTELSADDHELANAAKRLQANREKKDVDTTKKGRELRVVDGKNAGPARPNVEPAPETARSHGNSDALDAASKATKTEDAGSRSATSTGDNKRTLKPKKEKPAAKPTWTEPTSGFNTRIPPEMAELLHDLLYKLRKEGTKLTKQELAREALEDLLSKHRMLK